MKNYTRRLLFSMVTMIVCIAMLVGSTFAWFTDVAKSTNNVINPGRLDLEVEYTLDGENWEDLDGAENIFGDGLFEPGYTRVVAFKVRNNGSLAFKYKMSLDIISEKLGVNVAGENFALSDYLVASTAPAQEWTEGNQIGQMYLRLAFDADLHNSIAWTDSNIRELSFGAEDVVLTHGQEVVSMIKVCMPTDIGNVANAKDDESIPSLNLGVTVTATQAPVEEDSYDNKYDKDATYPVVDVAGLNNALTLGGNVSVEANLAPAAAIVADKNATLNMNGKTIANITDIWDVEPNSWSLVSVREGATLTIDGNGTFKAKENDCYAVDVQDDGCKVIIKSGTFIGNIHAVYVYTGEAVIEGGFFSVQQKFSDAAKADEFVLNCYDANRANGTAKITVKGGTFVNFNPADCQAEGAHTNFVAAGYKVVSATQSNGDVWYTVVAE